MSTYITSIQTAYQNHFPATVAIKAAQGFVATATIGLVAGTAPGVALVGGAMAAMATLIEAVTRPLIRDVIFTNYPQVAKAIQICISKMMSVNLLSLAATPWMSLTYKVSSSIPSIIAWLALNEGFFTRNEAIAEVF